MEAKEIRKKFLDYFASKGHAVVPSSSLIPTDPSVLLTTAGMQQFKAYYTGEADSMKDFGAKSAVSVQKSFRTSDIDEVGDETHQTFFEMLGNFSFGGYGKREAITYAHEFITNVLGLPISYVTIFKGSDVVPKDEESKAIWNELGITDVREEGMEDVFWGPTGSSGPCGPTTEIYGKNAEGRDVEIWNIVFNQFFYPGSREELLQHAPEKKLEPLKVFGVDTGAGLERIAMVSQRTKSNYETDLFAPLIELLPAELETRKKRIIADHLRGTAFLLADGVRPSNKGAGYILRRLMRRVMAYEYIYKIPSHVLDAVLHDVVHEYGDFYPELKTEAEEIRKAIGEEREKFGRTLIKGLNELHKELADIFNVSVEERDRGNASREEMTKKGIIVDTQIRSLKGFAARAFYYYQTFGITFDIIKDEAAKWHAWIPDEKDFEKEFEKHQEISRAGQEKKFGGHGLILDTGELKAANEEELAIVTRLHTATHLLNAALHKVLGDTVVQNGSDITVERTRFDFNFPRKLTVEEIAKIEETVNYAIQKDFPVTIQNLPLEDAKKTGALYMERSRYPDPVKVYTVGNAEETFSKELCGGPHVTHTGEIGHFKIAKEEASSAGVRRIRGVVE